VNASQSMQRPPTGKSIVPRLTTDSRRLLQRCGGRPCNCAVDNDRSILKRAAIGNAASAVAPPIVRAALQAPGQPLALDIRRAMEKRSGHDFSRVRVHADALADGSARAVNASAYTVGHEI